MEKLNVAELLKDCPKGMELDCTICNNVKFIELDKNPNFPIKLIANNGYEFYLSKYGQVHNIDDAKCVIFPKGKTTWEGFQRPFRDGDVVVCKEGGVVLQIFILKSYLNNNKGYCYIGYDLKNNKFFEAGNLYIDRLATEEEKEKLFKAIKDNGYKWNPETKTLEKLIVPKFEVGDWVEFKYYERKPEKVIRIENDVYWLSSGRTIMFQDESAWDLATKFDITTLNPYDRVLVRDSNDEYWNLNFFSFQGDKHFCTARGYYAQCIPFEDNKHLLGTTNDCDDYYKTWK